MRCSGAHTRTPLHTPLSYRYTHACPDRCTHRSPTVTRTPCPRRFRASELLDQAAQADAEELRDTLASLAPLQVTPLMMRPPP